MYEEDSWEYMRMIPEFDYHQSRTSFDMNGPGVLGLCSAGIRLLDPPLLLLLLLLSPTIQIAFGCQTRSVAWGCSAAAHPHPLFAR